MRGPGRHKGTSVFVSVLKEAYAVPAIIRSIQFGIDKDVVRERVLFVCGDGGYVILVLVADLYNLECGVMQRFGHCPANFDDIYRTVNHCSVILQ